MKALSTALPLFLSCIILFVITPNEALFAQDELFAVGEYCTILRNDGTDWQLQLTTTSFYDVWAASENDIFIVGFGLALRYDGTRLITTSYPARQTPSRNAIYGFSSEDVYSVGYGGVILHYDGNDWSLMESCTSENLLDVFCAPGDSVFAVGENGTIACYDGSSWSLMDAGVSADLRAVWGSSAHDMFASVAGDTVMLHYDGIAWEPMPNAPGGYIWCIWGTSGSDVFAAGSGGYITHYDGFSWSAMASGTTVTIRDIWGNSHSDVFVSGNSGKILHYDGVSWTQMSSGTNEYLYGISGASGDEVYSVGLDGIILRFDGEEWSFLMSPGSIPYFIDLNKVWATFGTEAVAVGVNGTILHYDGEVWEQMFNISSEDLLDVWGNSMYNIYAVGENGTILHYNGLNWVPMTSGTTETIRAIWGSDDWNMFAAGDNGLLLQYLYGSWYPMDSPAPTATFQDIWGFGKTSVYAMCVGTDIYNYSFITHWDGVEWCPLQSLVFGFSRMWLCPAGDFFFSGSISAVSRYDGCRMVSTISVPEHQYDIWGYSMEEVYTCGDYGSVMRFDGESWTDIGVCTGTHLRGICGRPRVTAEKDDRHAVHGLPGGELLTAGTFRGTLPDEYRGSLKMGSDGCLDEIEVPLLPFDPLRGIWESPEGEIFAVGDNGSVFHFDGVHWERMDGGSCSWLKDVYGFSSSDVFAVGCGKDILHYDGMSWGPVANNQSDCDLESVWGRSNSEVFAVGLDGEIRKYNGTYTEWVFTPTSSHLYGVHGSTDAGSVKCVGQNGTILMFNETAWSAMDSGTSETLYGIWVNSADEAVAVGANGTILQFDGDTWAKRQSGTTSDLFDVWGTSMTDIYAVGEESTVLHYDGFGWSPWLCATGTEEIPLVTALEQNYPNPFNPSTAIRYSLDKTGPVRLEIFDCGGRIVRHLVDTVREPGIYEMAWDGRGDNGRQVSSGVYFCRLVTLGGETTRKMVLLR